MMAGRRGWRAWLAAALSAGLAVGGALTIGRGSANLPSASSLGPGEVRPDVIRPVPLTHQIVPAAVAPHSAAASGAAAPGAPVRRQNQRALVPDARGGQVQLPYGRAEDAAAAVRQRVADQSRPAMFLPGWRVLLEHRWRERLAVVTELSLAFHNAADCVRDGSADSGQDQAGRLRPLMRQAVAARQALTDTEDALARLSAGRFGQCEQCEAMIDAAQLARHPEERYCAHCAQIPPRSAVPAPLC